MQSDTSSETESRQPTVWLVNEGGHDYSSLEEFGRVIPLSRGGVNPFGPDRLMVMLASRLAHASADDYLAISGLPLLNALAISMWLVRFKRVRLLQFSTKRGKYQKLELSYAALERMATSEPGPAD